MREGIHLTRNMDEMARCFLLELQGPPVASSSASHGYSRVVGTGDERKTVLASCWAVLASLASLSRQLARQQLCWAVLAAYELPVGPLGVLEWC